MNIKDKFTANAHPSHTSALACGDVDMIVDLGVHIR